MKTWTALVAGGSAAVVTGAVAVVGLSGSAPVASAKSDSSSSGAATLSGTTASKATEKKNEKLTFEVAAAITGLRPGAAQSLPVQVTNPSTNKKVTLTVVTLDITVGDAGPTCSGTNLSVGGYDANATGASIYELAPGQTRTVPVAIGLVDSTTVDQTDCLGATFPLTVKGTAVGTK